MKDSGAVISDCGLFRYLLWRQWGSNITCVFIMLNPSTADYKKNDATIRRCIYFAKREGCGKLVVVNLNAFRSRHPSIMRQAKDPIGPLNNKYLIQAVVSNDTGPIIAAWGAKGGDRGQEIMKMFDGMLSCLGTTKNGHPRHPLYVPNNQPLIKLHLT